MENKIKAAINDSIEVKTLILESPKIISEIQNAAKIIGEQIQEGKKILIAGNGGSAADSQHISAEFVSRFMFDRPGLPSIALTTDTSAITAIGNDYGFEKLFSRQIQAIGNSGDVFIGISTSGKSKNIIEGFKEASNKGLFTIGFSGIQGFEEFECNCQISVPSTATARIQEAHILIGHIICLIVEAKIFDQNEEDTISG